MSEYVYEVDGPITVMYDAKKSRFYLQDEKGEIIKGTHKPLGKEKLNDGIYFAASDYVTLKVGKDVKEIDLTSMVKGETTKMGPSLIANAVRNTVTIERTGDPKKRGPLVVVGPANLAKDAGDIIIPGPKRDMINADKKGNKTVLGAYGLKSEKEGLSFTFLMDPHHAGTYNPNSRRNPPVPIKRTSPQGVRLHYATFNSDGSYATHFTVDGDQSLEKNKNSYNQWRKSAAPGVGLDRTAFDPIGETHTTKAPTLENYKPSARVLQFSGTAAGGATTPAAPEKDSGKVNVKAFLAAGKDAQKTFALAVVMTKNTPLRQGDYFGDANKLKAGNAFIKAHQKLALEGGRTGSVQKATLQNAVDAAQALIDAGVGNQKMKPLLQAYIKQGNTILKPGGRSQAMAPDRSTRLAGFSTVNETHISGALAHLAPLPEDEHVSTQRGNPAAHGLPVGLERDRESGLG